MGTTMMERALAALRPAAAATARTAAAAAARSTRPATTLSAADQGAGRAWAAGARRKFSCSCSALVARQPRKLASLQEHQAELARDGGDAAAVGANKAVRRRDLPTNQHTYLGQLVDLGAYDRALDLHPAQTTRFPLGLAAKHGSTLTHMDDTDESPFARYEQPKPSDEDIRAALGSDDVATLLAQVTELTPGEIRALYRFPLVTKRVVNMTGKGKMASMYSIVVVGNGNGLVGVGEGKDETVQRAVDKAFVQAVRGLDYVERFDQRTVWGEMRSNFGTCKLVMRPRPQGFGLRTNPFVHQVAKAAGISDLSAKVYGSRNPMRVIKLAVQMLHGGTVPLDFGDGFGNKGQRRNKKAAATNQTADELALMRGRAAVAVPV